jgi:hypothetical protein
VLYTEQAPLQLPIATEVLDANSIATVMTVGTGHASEVAYFRDWNVPSTNLLFTMGVISQPKQPQPRESAVLDVATANREVLVEEDVHLFEIGVPGIFVAARPARKRLFEMQFTFPQGGLPKRKPFVWVSKHAPEE